VGVATTLLVIALVADLLGWQLSEFTTLLYAVIVGTYLIVLVEGALLGSDVSRVTLSTVHLIAALAMGLAIVQGTGGVNSPFSFLYLLAILDAAIIAGRRIALLMASVCSVTYGTQLVFQLYGILPAGSESIPSPYEFMSAGVAHLGAFYLIAILAGRLATMLEAESQIASTAQYDLQRVLELHATVLEALPLGVLTVDPGGNISTANQAAAWILDTPIEDLIGHGLPGFLFEFLEGEESYCSITVTLGEKERQLSLSRAHVKWTGGGEIVPPRIDLTLLVLEDRTDLYGLERRLREQERLASVGELAAAIAHEIRNPLASMSGSLELLQNPGSTTGEQRHKLRSIVSREVEQLNRLVDNFLVYARPSQPSYLTVDVVHLAREVADAIRHDPEWRERKLSMLGEAQLLASVDPEQIRQLLWNILRNAVEASSEGKPVSLNVEFETVENAGWFVMEVVDSGTGIDPVIRDTLFEPFKTTKQGGTGLGLSIVHRIVEGHGGYIDLGSSETGGTEVRVVLPVGNI
jgi:two-component system sensor histidine kinase PilS (NtrC family)